LLVEIEDHYVTATPEGVSIELTLAGLGSRFTAYLVDVLIQAAILAVAFLTLGTAASNSSGTERYLLVGIGALSFFVVFFAYFVFFEAVDSGRSPGKRLAGLRVVDTRGGAITFRSSLLRNVARLVDIQPFPLYAVGCAFVLVTKRNQRLGDLLGGTLVIRERMGDRRMQAQTGWSDPAQWAGSPVAPQFGEGPARGLPPMVAKWDVTAVTAQDMAVVRTFLANRWGYVPEARARLAHDLAGRLWPKVAGPRSPIDAERFLELVSLVKASRG
jgi:uncharacterized RDD family membrane protein YckC